MRIFFSEHVFAILKEDILIQGCARSLKHMLTEAYSLHFRVSVIEGRCAAGSQGADVRGATIMCRHCPCSYFLQGREAVADFACVLNVVPQALAEFVTAWCDLPLRGGQPEEVIVRGFDLGRALSVSGSLQEQAIRTTVLYRSRVPLADELRQARAVGLLTRVVRILGFGRPR